MSLASFLAAAALVAAPSPYPPVIEAPCPDRSVMSAGCFYDRGVDGASGPVVYLDGDRFTLRHELGHAYDSIELDDGEREAIRRAMRWRGWRGEGFADFWAGCSLGLDPADPFHRASRIYGDWRGRDSVGRRCALIARAAG